MQYKDALTTSFFSEVPQLLVGGAWVEVVLKEVSTLLKCEACSQWFTILCSTQSGFG
jgi:hypothetical protein